MYIVLRLLFTCNQRTHQKGLKTLIKIYDTYKNSKDYRIHIKENKHILSKLTKELLSQLEKINNGSFIIEDKLSEYINSLNEYH